MSLIKPRTRGKAFARLTTRLEHETHRVGDDLDDDLHYGPDREIVVIVASSNWAMN